MKSALKIYVVIYAIFGLIFCLLPGIAVEFLLTILKNALLMGLIFGGFLLLRPITNHLISPKHRVWLWIAGWWSIFFPMLYEKMRGLSAHLLRLPGLSPERDLSR